MSPHTLTQIRGALGTALTEYLALFYPHKLTNWVFWKGNTTENDNKV